MPVLRGIVPLSPNWRLDNKGKGVRLVPHVDDPENRHCTFEIVDKAKDQSPGTVKQGDGLCPYPDCGRVIDGDEQVKPQAQSHQMGLQLYAVVYKQTVEVVATKGGKHRLKSVRNFRGPRLGDDNSANIRAILDVKRAEWEARNIVPEEAIRPGYETTIRWPLKRYGLDRWTPLLSSATPRPLHWRRGLPRPSPRTRTRNDGSMTDVDHAALAYVGIALDKLVNYNSLNSFWDPTRQAVRRTFSRHDFGFNWRPSEIAPAIAGLGYDWIVEETGKAIKELVQLSSGNDESFIRCFACDSTTVWFAS